MRRTPHGSRYGRSRRRRALQHLRPTFQVLEDRQLLAITVADPSFESIALVAGSYNGSAVSPQGTPWTYSSGGAGVSANGTGVTGGNPNAPDGANVAFIQNAGWISQAITNPTPGSYALSFKAANRVNWGDAQSFQVLVDDQVVGTFGNLSAIYQERTTSAFLMSAGTHTVRFQGLNQVGDTMAFLDDVRIAAASAPAKPGTVLSVTGRDGLAGWSVAVNGGTSSGQGSVAAGAGGLVFAEGDSSSVVLSRTLTIPANASLLTFDMAAPSFDASGNGAAPDRYEVALDDASGNSLVPTVGGGGDAFLRFAEGQPTVVAAGASLVGVNATLNIAGLAPGSTARLVVRLISGDGDHGSTATFGADPAGIYRVPGMPGDMTTVTVAYLSRSSGFNDQIALIQAQDEMGRVGGILPNNDGSYSRAILAGQAAPQALFSTGQAPGITVVYTLPAGTLLMPFAVQNDTLANAIAQNPSNSLNAAPLSWFTYKAANPDNFDHYQHINRLDGAPADPAIFALEDLTSGGDQDFNDILFSFASGVPIHATASASAAPSSLAGIVYADANNDGHIQPGEPGVAGVKVVLSGRDFQGNPIGATTLTGVGGSYSFAGLPAGTYAVTEAGSAGLIAGKVTVGNQGGMAGARQITVIGLNGVSATGYNFGLDRPPTITSAAPREVQAGNIYVYEPAATDPDGDTLHYSLLAGPANATFDPATGRISWPTTLANLGGQVFDLRVDDGRGGTARETFTAQVVDVPNRPPIFTSTPVVDAYVGVPYSYHATASDPDSDLLNFWLSYYVAGMILPNPGPTNTLNPNPTAGTVLWTPTGDQAGLHSVKILVSDGRGGSSEQDFQVMVHQAPSNHAPVIVSDPVRTSAPPQTYQYQVRAVDQDNDKLKYSLVQKPSYSMWINPDSGLITWYSPTSGIKKVTVAVNDGQGGIDHQTYFIAPPGVDVVGSTGGTPGAVEFSPFPTNRADATAGSSLLATAQSGNFPHPFVPAVIGDFGTYNPPVNGNPIFNSVDDTTGSPDPVLGETSGFYRVPFDVASTLNSPWLVVTANADDFGAVFLNGHLLPDAQGNAYAFQEGGEYSVSAVNTGWLVPGRNELLFAVNNSGGGPTGLSFEADLLEANQHIAPKIKSTPPTAARVGDPFEYLVRVSNPSGDQLTFNLAPSTAGGTVPAGMAIDPITGLITWTPMAGQVGLRSARVVVSNFFGQSDSQSLPIQVGIDDGSNTPPVLLNRPNFAAVAAGVPFKFDAIGFDANGDSVRYTLPVAPDGMGIDPITGMLRWVPTAKQTGTQDFLLRLSDGRGANLYPFAVFVPGVVPTPYFTTHPSDKATVGQPYIYQVGAVDADGNPISFSIDPATPPPDGMGFLVDRPDVLVWTPDEAGTVTVIIDASNGRGGVAQQKVTLTATAGGTGQGPDIYSHYRTNIQVGRTYQYQVLANNLSNAPLTYGLVNPPPGLTISKDGLVTWPTTGATLTLHVFGVTVSNAYGSFTQPVGIQVDAQGQNQDPVIDPVTLPGAVVGRSYAVHLTGSDPDYDPLTWSLATKLDGMAIDPTSGVLVWTPTEEQVGTNPLTVRLRDGQGGFAEATLSVVVRGTDLPPQFKPDYPPPATQHALYTYQVQAYDPEGGPLTYRLFGPYDSPPPSGWGISSTGLITWNDPTIGYQQFVVRVTDDQGNTAQQGYTLQVLPQVPPAPPTIDGSHLLDRAAIGATYASYATATAPGGHAVNFSLGGNPPTNLSITTDGHITWTPGAAQYPTPPTTVPVTIVATDQVTNLRTSLTYYVTVRAANRAPSVTPFAFDPATVVANSPFIIQSRGSDLDGDRLSWSLESAGVQPIPQGMTIDSGTGRIDWADDGQVGDYRVQVVATDPFGLSDSKTLTVRVVSDVTDPSVQILLDPFSPVVVGTRVTVTVRAGDDAGVRSVTLKRDGLTVVLDAHNSTSFVVTAAGTISFTATATDVNGRTSPVATSALAVLPVSTSPLVARLTAYRDIGAASTMPFGIPTTVTAPVEVFGTVGGANGTDPASYTMEVLSVEGALLQTMVAPTAPTAITNGVLGRFDPTLLANGSYILRLTARNGGVSPAVAEEVISVVGHFKLGNFQLSFTDLVIPVAGIPITVTRSYDTLNAGRRGDFGYGWTLDEGNFKLQLSQPDGTLTGLNSHMPFHYGERIVLTRPGRDPVGFTFQPERILTGGGPLTLPTNYWRPYFKPDFGVSDELIVPYAELILDEGSGDFLSTFDGGTPYNPADPIFGGNGQFTLKTRQGLKYVLDADSGDVASVIDRNDNILTFDETGIYSSTGRHVLFRRNVDGFIDQITDKNGNFISYEYAGGNLVRVVDREANAAAQLGAPAPATTFTYKATPAHYLESIADPLGRPAARTDYYDDGRLKKVTDASGKTTQYSWDSVGLVQHITDQLDQTTVVTLDARGNVLKTVDPEGQTTVSTYDNVDHLLTQTTVVGLEDTPANGEHDDLTTKYGYVGDDRVSTTDPRGNVTYFGHNEYGQQTSTTNAMGSTISTYDGTGLLRAVEDATKVATNLDYDAKGNLTAVRDDRGNTLGRNTYNPYGDVTSTTPVAGAASYFDYDEDGHRVASWYFDGVGAGRVQVLDVTRYKADRVDKTIHAVLPSGQFIEANLAAATIPLQYVKWTTETYYNDAGQVISQTDRQGGVTESTYDVRGQLIQTRTRAAGSTTFLAIRTAYDEAGQAYATTDPVVEGTNGPIAGTYTKFDKAGRAERTERRKGMVISFTGPADRLVAALTTPGTVVSSSGTDYDNAGRVTESTDDGGLRSQTTYNNFGEVTQSRQEVVDQFGTVVWLVTQTVYDTLGRPVLTTDPYLESATNPVVYATRTDYDTLGRAYRSFRLKDVVVTLAGNATSVAAAGSEVWSTTTVYDTRGQVSRSVAADGGTTDYEFDNLGRQKAVIGPAATIDGQLVRLRTETVYGLDGRVSQAWDNIRQLADGTTIRVAARKTSYAYDRNGNVILTTYADQTTTSATYDDLGRKMSETNQLQQTRSFEYNAAGRLSAVVLPQVADPLKNNTLAHPRYVYEYDAQGNQTLIRDPLGRETHFTFDTEGNQLTRTLPLGFGPDGKVSNDGSDPTGGDFTETAQYDDRGRVTLQVSFEGVVTTFQYDATTGRLTTKRLYASLAAYNNGTGTAAETWTHTYDAFGRTVQVVQAITGGASRSTTTAYDAEGRLASVTSLEGIVNYRYDDLGRLKRTFTGTPTAVLDDTLYGYDALGRLETVTVAAQNGVAFAANARPTTTYRYDLRGNLSRIDLPNGTIREFTYDQLNHLKRLTEYAPDSTPADLSNNAKLADYDYTLRSDGTRGQATETFWFTDGSGPVTPHQVNTAWIYDDMGRLIDESLDHYVNSLDRVEHFTYDLTGNRLIRTLDKGRDNSIEETTTSTFDANDRLTAELLDRSDAPDQATTYGYDHTQQTSKEGRESGTLLSRVDFGYNLLGQMAEVRTTTYTGGNPSRIERVTYAYGADGIRVSAVQETDATGDGTFETAKRTEYLNDAANFTGYSQAVRETTTDLRSGYIEKVVAFTIGLDQIGQTTVAYTNNQPGTPATLVFGADGHGSTRFLTDLAGAIAEVAGVRQVFDYAAYGALLNIDASLAATGLLYSGEQTDARVGRQYLRARWYDVTTGRFDRLDPFSGMLKDPQSFHKYAFVSGDPINGSDPSGLFEGLGGLIGAISDGLSLTAIRAQGAARAWLALRPSLAYIAALGGNAINLWSLATDPHSAMMMGPLSFAQEVQAGVLAARTAWTAGSRGFALFRGVDSVNRATGVFGMVTLDSINHPLGSLAGSYNPPGWEELVELTTNSTRARGHLWARWFGGPGTDPRNIVPLFTSANKTMLEIESAIKRALTDGANGVFYRVVPVYRGLEEIPIGIQVEAAIVDAANVVVQWIAHPQTILNVHNPLIR